MSDLNKVICHAEGDRCHGCDHYLGKSAICTYATDDSQAKRITELEAALAAVTAERDALKMRDPMPTMTAAFNAASESVSKFYGPAMKTKLPWEEQP